MARRFQAVEPAPAPTREQAVRRVDDWELLEDLDALRQIDPDVGYAEWRNYIFGIKAKHGESAKEGCRVWSAAGAKFSESAFETLWKSGDDPAKLRTHAVTAATVHHAARAAGWTPQRAESSLTRLTTDESEQPADKTPFDEASQLWRPGATPPDPPPVVCKDPFGLPLLHGDEFLFLYGLPKAGKSFVALGLGKQVVEQGGRCLMVCWERLGKTRARRHVITVGNHGAYRDWFAVGQASVRTYHDELVEWLHEAPCSLVVFDSMSAAGVPTDGSPFADFYWRNLAPFASPTTCMVAIDHAAKRSDPTTAPGPLGSITKAAIADAFYMVAPGKEGFAITERDVTLKGANDEHAPEKWVLRMTDGVPTVWNGSEQQVEQLYAMIADDDTEMSVRRAHETAVAHGITEVSHSTFNRDYKRWADEAF